MNKRKIRKFYRHDIWQVPELKELLAVPKGQVLAEIVCAGLIIAVAVGILFI